MRHSAPRSVQSGAHGRTASPSPSKPSAGSGTANRQCRSAGTGAQCFSWGTYRPGQIPQPSADNQRTQKQGPRACPLPPPRADLTTLPQSLPWVPPEEAPPDASPGRPQTPLEGAKPGAAVLATQTQHPGVPPIPQPHRTADCEPQCQHLQTQNCYFSRLKESTFKSKRKDGSAEGGWPPASGAGPEQAQAQLGRAGKTGQTGRWPLPPHRAAWAAGNSLRSAEGGEAGCWHRAWPGCAQAGGASLAMPVPPTSPP